jgi:uncharacterized protein (DUF1015 family)
MVPRSCASRRHDDPSGGYRTIPRSPSAEVRVPIVHPFRALRYAPDVIADLAAVVAPPYDVIGETEHRELLARDPRNVVRLDFPRAEPGEEPDERYRRASRLLSTWRSDGTLHRDPRPALYPYEQTYTVPGTEIERVRRGLFARVRLEDFGPDSGIRPHERTLAEPREDRYRLLRATGVNTSPVVGMYEDSSGAVPRWLAAVSEPAIADLRDDVGVRHRLWMIADDTDVIPDICRSIGASVITLADGHHRYETALRYRDERMIGAADTGDPAWAEILMLLLEPTQGPVTVLPTHRVVLHLGAGAAASLRDHLPELFEIEEEIGRHALIARYRAFGPDAGGEGRFGLWLGGAGYVVRARREQFEPFLPVGGTALRRLDVTLAGVALERLAGIDAAAVSAGGRLAYSKDASEAIELADGEGDAAGAALLLEPTPAREIIAVAGEGDLMPQKSTYIYPKALTGLVINPLE